MISGLCIFHDLMNISSGSRISQRLQRGGAPTCYYCSQRSCARLCFHRCLSFCSQGCVCGRHPPWQTPPNPGQTPPWTDIPRADTPNGQTPPCPLHAGIHTPPAHCTTSSGSHCSGWYASERRWGVSLVLVPDPSMYLSYYTLLVLLLSY